MRGRQENQPADFELAALNSRLPDLQHGGGSEDLRRQTHQSISALQQLVEKHSLKTGPPEMVIGDQGPYEVALLHDDEGETIGQDSVLYRGGCCTTYPVRNVYVSY